MKMKSADGQVLVRLRWIVGVFAFACALIAYPGIVARLEGKVEVLEYCAAALVYGWSSASALTHTIIDAAFSFDQLGWSLSRFAKQLAAGMCAFNVLATCVILVTKEVYGAAFYLFMTLFYFSIFSETVQVVLSSIFKIAHFDTRESFLKTNVGSVSGYRASFQNAEDPVEDPQKRSGRFSVKQRASRPDQKPASEGLIVDELRNAGFWREK